MSGPLESADVLMRALMARIEPGGTSLSAPAVDEGSQLLHAAMNAQTHEQWQNAVAQWKLYQETRERRPLAMQGAERHLLEEIERNRTNLLRDEYAMAPEGQKPVTVEEPSVPGFLSEVFRAPQEHYARRTRAPYQQQIDPTKNMTPIIKDRFE